MTPILRKCMKASIAAKSRSRKPAQSLEAIPSYIHVESRKAFLLDLT